jgi:C4-type Zn-finger protein
MGTATPRVTQGTARTDYTGDAGFFTQEQQFKAAGAGRAAPRQAFEGVRSTIDEAGATQEILKALAEGARTFKPTGVGESLFNQPGGAQGGAQAYIENLQSARARAAERYGGASNAALVDDANTAAGLGVPRVQASDSTTSATGQTQLRGSTAATEAAAAPAPAGGGEAATAVAQALETINTTLAALSQRPLTIPDSLASSIAAGSEAVVNKLDAVTIKSMPAVDISAASITSISSNISTSTANAATVGAQQVIDVDELKNELIEAGGLIDTRIFATTESFEAKILQGEAESLETKAIVDSHTAELGTINETLPTVEEDITGLKSTDLDLAVKVDLNAVEINTLDIEVTRVAGVSDITATTVEGFQTSIDDVLATSDQVTTRLGQFEEEFITISQDVSDAKSDAADATLAVRDLKISLTDFRDSLTSKDTQIEATISINAESAKKIRDKVSDDIIPDVNTLKTDVGTATSIAQAALNLALRKKDK